MHKSVMLLEVLKYLDIYPNGVYFDCTFGGGGHSFEIYKYLNKNGELNVFDKDFSFIIDIRRKIDFCANMKLYKCSFENINNIASNIGVFGEIDGIIADLGIATNHLLDFNRGFGFSKNGFLDMRLNLEQNVRAIDWLNFASFEELLYTFCFFDNYNLSVSIVNKIVSFRTNLKIQTVNDFYSIVSNVCLSDKFLSKSFNRIFQSVRFFINNDLYLLFKFLDNAFLSLRQFGILIIISFNSVEDKIVKNFFSKKLVKPFVSFIKPSVKELDFNYSSKSAVMRVFIKL